MNTMSFDKQIQSGLSDLTRLFECCIQRYALQCSSEGKFAQLIFGGDLARGYRSQPSNSSNSALTELLCRHFVTFEEHCGTYVKTLAFFIRDLLINEQLQSMNIVEQRVFLLKLHEKLKQMTFDSTGTKIRNRADINVEHCVDRILDTLPRDVFDRHGIYRDLLVRLVVGQIDRVDDYLKFHEQLTFVTIGPSIDQSRLLDGILVPIPNSKKLLSSFTSRTPCNLIFLNLSDSPDSYEILDRDHQFFSYDSLVYRQFVKNDLKDVNLIVSVSLINPSFLSELHQANINVIDTIDEQTFEFLLTVFKCTACNRLILTDGEIIDRCSTTLLDRYVSIDGNSYIYLSSNGTYQTLLSCVPNATLFTTTEKILLNLMRLMKFLLVQLEKNSELVMARESDYLKYLSETIVEFRSLLIHRRIALDRSIELCSSYDQPFPICFFREYLLNGIEFVCQIQKIDGIYSRKRD